MMTPTTTETLLEAPNLPLNKSNSPAGARVPAGTTPPLADENNEHQVTVEEPCVICGHSSWCFRSDDGRVATCRRKNNGKGQQHTDRSGAAYWTYQLDGLACSTAPQPHKADAPLKEAALKTPTPEQALADAKKIVADVVVRLKEDPGAPFEAEALKAIVMVKKQDEPEYVRFKAACKKAGVSLRDLNKSLTRTEDVIEGHDSDAFVPGQTDDRGRLKIPINKELSVFAEEIGRVIGPKNIWFMKGDEIVDVRDQNLSTKIRCVSFHPLSATETRTLVEDHIQTGHLYEEYDILVFTPQSMSREDASAVLKSCQLHRELPRIERIMDVPIPLICDGKLVYPKTGYDSELKTYCLPGAPEIKPLPLEESKKLLLKVHEEFCFKDDLSRTVAVARLLTAFCRGLMGWDARMPVWVFEGNRPRAGKDYCAAITQLVFETRANEDSPLDSNSEETCKRIMSALRAGRRRMHFANCKGHIDNGVFEQAVTSKMFSARSLGTNDAASDLTLPNEIEFSVSGNIGFSFTEDFDLRCRRISLHYSEEDANARKFKTPDMHGWVLGHRAELLGALAGLVQHWFEKGRPDGTTLFTSFPEWARIVGGIMTCCGLGDPCVAQQDDNLTGDEVTQHMKALYQRANAVHGNEYVQKKEVRQLAKEGELFGWWNLDDPKGQTCFGKKLLAFHDRELGGIKMTIDKTDKSRLKYRFTKEGAVEEVKADKPVDDKVKEGAVDKVKGGKLVKGVIADKPAKEVKADKPATDGTTTTTTVRVCEPCEPCEPFGGGPRLEVVPGPRLVPGSRLTCEPCEPCEPPQPPSSLDDLIHECVSK